MKKVTVIGASLGGLVAAAELRQQGFDVTIFEKGKSVGGLYNKIETPFGIQELGMHVLYVDDNHFRHLCHIFGDEVFNVMEDCDVDIGSSTNFESIFFNSLYPNVLGHPDEKTIVSEILDGVGNNAFVLDAKQEAVRRFGNTGGNKIVSPILEKLWKTDPTLLTSEALHCFFDLRRMVVCEKPKADKLKENLWFDQVIANPIQSQPKGEVYGGRKAVTFKTKYMDLAERAKAWALQAGVKLEFNKQISVDDGCLMVGGLAVLDTSDACILALPIHLLAASEVLEKTDQLELSIYYIQLKKKIEEQFPAYYMLCHDARYKSSRIVNYDEYHKDRLDNLPSVLSVEVIHAINKAPTKAEIAQEIINIVPRVEIKDSFQVKQALKICSPTIKNYQLFELVKNRIETNFESKPIYFTGMRADTGIFFSHHTIGLAYDSALECSSQLH